MIAVLTCLPLLIPSTDAPAPRFEREIQPLLARCIGCHGPDKQRGGLRLDQRAGALLELDSGERALIPGRPADSALLHRVAETDPRRRMPPRGEPLRPEQIELLRRWIQAGADWPDHWAYRPLVRPQPPTLDSTWARTPIDLFIQHRLREAGLTPAPEADRRTLLRRVTLDLTGLPPLPHEVEAFLHDHSPDAYERVIDRLLASPRYGERWARHWMDVVHFAETHGHDQDRPREHAWPYRDYLIRAFNEDKPYARFVQEQVAGDRLFPADPWATVATGFLATGSWDESSLRDIREDGLDREIARYLDRDDIVSTVMNTFVSTTVHCARCHDHKFDPVSQREYYGLQAVFAGTDKGNRPFDFDPTIAARRRQLTQREQQLARAQQSSGQELLQPELRAAVAAWEKELRRRTSGWRTLQPSELHSAGGAKLTKLSDGSVLSSGPRPDRDVVSVVASTDLKRITALRLEVLPHDTLPRGGPGRQENGNLHLNELVVLAAGQGEEVAFPVVWRKVRADFDQEGWTIQQAVDGVPTSAWGIYPQVNKAHAAVFFLKEPLTNEDGTTFTLALHQTHGQGHLIGRFRLSVTGEEQPIEAAPLSPELATLLALEPTRRTEAQQRTLTRHYLEDQIAREKQALPPPSLVYCGGNQFLVDAGHRPAEKPRPVRLLKRGDIRTPGAEVTPGALSCIPTLPATLTMNDPQQEGERRAGLARWLTDPRNGLTWRSMANRVWQYHLGRGLVDTPNDFGRMGSLPTHPELLDWLAATLRDTGSLKQLHRLILTSAVYRQSVRVDPRAVAVDADNRLLWRMNRQRLDAETIRDTALVLSGQLDSTMGGPSVRQFVQSPGIHVTPIVDYQSFDVQHRANRRRSVYRFIFRTLPDPFMESLDCPDGSQLSPVRGESLTALQALTLLNDRHLLHLCDRLAEQLTREKPTLSSQLERAYQLILCRPPTATELQRLTTHATRHGLVNCCRLLLNSNEFLFVD